MTKQECIDEIIKAAQHQVKEYENKSTIGLTRWVRTFEEAPWDIKITHEYRAITDDYISVRFDSVDEVLARFPTCKHVLYLSYRNGVPSEVKIIPLTHI